MHAATAINTVNRPSSDAPAISNASVLKQLRWRYATKRFDRSRRIPGADWTTLEEALVLTPSSFGLQPWRFVVVTDQRVKDQLVAASWNQTQVADASHIVVFAARRGLDAADIDRFIHRTAQVRGVDESSLGAYRQMMAGSLLTPRPGFNIDDWAARQTYIAHGNFMTTAAVLGIDACPMEGVEPAKYDAILGLAGRGYSTVVVAAAGYRAADDRYAVAPKVRFDITDVIVRFE